MFRVVVVSPDLTSIDTEHRPEVKGVWIGMFLGSSHTYLQWGCLNVYGRSMMLDGWNFFDEVDEICRILSSYLVHYIFQRHIYIYVYVFNIYIFYVYVQKHLFFKTCFLFEWLIYQKNSRSDTWSIRFHAFRWRCYASPWPNVHSRRSETDVPKNVKLVYERNIYNHLQGYTKEIDIGFTCMYSHLYILYTWYLTSFL